LFSSDALQIKGTILIPRAHIAPQTFSNSKSVSDDVVFIHEKKSIMLSSLIDLDVNIVMGDEVTLAIKGLKGRLTGAVHLMQTKNTPLNASGSIRIIDGKYVAYGQDLKIEQGQLTFTGGVLDNPLLEIRAFKLIKQSNPVASTAAFTIQNNNIQSTDFSNQVTVGVDVSGRLKAPKVHLFSIPSNLSQADILSLLLLGKPASEASKSGGQLLLAAARALNLDSGTKGLQLLTQLKQKLGLDFNLTSETQYNQKNNQSTENTGISVGKSLSKRLYLSYNFGLSQQGNNALMLNYILSQFFSIQINTSVNGSGVDLLYTREKK